ncbi:LbetaH domain-containing protein [Xanthobacter sediminis]|uniref:hypothetical protein n=1 Tax=Xanthobacter sediminis TaxID=3119926 RepID=UPI0037279850
MTTVPDTAVPGHALYGTADRSHIPAAMVAGGLYDLSPTTLREDGTRPRPLFDLGTTEGRNARNAYLADVERSEDAKDAARARHAAKQGNGEGMAGAGI